MERYLIIKTRDELLRIKIGQILYFENTSASLVPQMIAVSPEEFRRIAGLFRESGYRHADINLGCPFPMQARQHRGAGILPYPDEVKVLLETIFEFPEIQFSVKLRLGWDSPEEAQALLPFLNGLPLTSHIASQDRYAAI